MVLRPRLPDASAQLLQRRNMVRTRQCRHLELGTPHRCRPVGAYAPLTAITVWREVGIGHASGDL